jgi:hypothetical protein
LPEGFFWLAQTHWSQISKRSEYLKAASDRNFPNAQVEYGYYLLKNSDDEAMREQGKNLIILGGENGDSLCAQRLSGLYRYYSKWIPADNNKATYYEQLSHQKGGSDCSTFGYLFL